MTSAVAQEIRKPIGFAAATIVTGTWTPTFSSGSSFSLKTATAETSNIYIPLSLERNSRFRGVRLKSIDLYVRITTADLSSAPTLTLFRRDYDAVVAGATGDATVVTVPTTNNAVVTADANDRLWTVTVTNPEWDLDTEAEATYMLQVTLPCAASTVVRFYHATAVFEQLT